MGRYCTACHHVDRSGVDKALLAHTAGYRRIAEQFALSATALRRHEREHLGDTLRTHKETQVLLDVASLLAELNDLHDAVRRQLALAEASADGRLVLAAVAEARRNIETLARLGPLGEIEQRLSALAEGEGHQHEHSQRRESLFEAGEAD